MISANSLNFLVKSELLEIGQPAPAMMKLLSRERRLFLLISSIGLAITMLAGLVVNQVIPYFTDESSHSLAPVPTHSDLPTRAPETWQASLASKLPGNSTEFRDSACRTLRPNWTVEENKNSGVKMTLRDWQMLDIAHPIGSVLWLDKSSVDCGSTVGIHASTYYRKFGTSIPAVPGPRTFEALRLGWYNGSGARLMWKSDPIELTQQASPVIHANTRMLETTWPTTISMTVGSDWTPGFYLIVTVAPDGRIESAAPLIVRATAGSSSLLLVHSTLTWAAYNIFGGRSLYFGPGATTIERRKERSRVVSMDRPIIGSGALHLHRDAISLVQFIEKSGIDVDQVTDTDLDTWPSMIGTYNGLVFSGHPEYFTRRMFSAVQGARNIGVNLAFLGANSAYWQTRIVASPSGPMRRVIVYRNPTEDPIKDPTLSTIRWDDPRINQPSSLLTGGIKTGVHVYGTLKPVSIPNWLKIPPTTELRGFAAESEIEARNPNPLAEPNGVHVIFRGEMHLTRPNAKTARAKLPTIEETLWFTTPSGAAVFNAGITMWSCDLMPSCAITTVDETTRSNLQSITEQVLRLWSQAKVGKKLT